MSEYLNLYREGVELCQEQGQIRKKKYPDFPENNKAIGEIKAVQLEKVL